MGKGRRAYRAAAGIATLSVVVTAGCGGKGNAPQGPTVGDYSDLDVNASELGTEINNCSQSGSSGYDESSYTLTLDISAATAVVLAIDGTDIKVNGYTCVDSSGDALSKAVVRKIEVNGDTDGEKVILDLLPGSFGYPIFSNLGGITVDLGGGSDSFMVRGTTGADSFTMGTDGTDAFAELSGDSYADVVVKNTETYKVSLSDGADDFTAAGGSISAEHLTSGVTSLDPMSTAVTVYGGEGADTLQGGAGADTLWGGPGNDTFATDADGTDGADRYFGGADTDTMDYSTRTNAVTAMLAPAGSDASTPAADPASRTGSVDLDTNNLTGAGDLLLSVDGSAVETISVSSGNACADVIALINAAFTGVASCGSGQITIAGTSSVEVAGGDSGVLTEVGFISDAQDGESSEGDFVSYSVENMKGGDAADTLTGSNVSNTLEGGEGNDTMWGGPGNSTCENDEDVIKGGAGDDIFNMSDTADCGDTIYGGDGTDEARYHERSNPLTISLDNTADDGENNEEDNVRSDVEVVYGGSGADDITGSMYANVLHGGGGNDTLNGGSGDDTLIGNTGDDTLNGDAGDDLFDELEADDAVYTTTGKGDGNDIINGGAGFDKVTFADRSTDAVTITLCFSDTLQGAGSAADGSPACTANDGEASVDATNNIINVEHVVGTTAAVVNTITGTSVDEFFEGGAGNDVIDGAAGNDTIYGNAGDDNLSGGAGDDYIDSGLGDDDPVDGGEGDGDICVNGGGTDVTSNCEL